MATTTFTLRPSQQLPVGATVAAYPVSNWPNSIPNTGAAPIGSATNSQTMGTTGLTFTGLTAGTRYVAYTLVGSEYHYVGFTVGDESELGGGDTQHSPTGAAGGDLAGTYPNPTLGAGLARESVASAVTSELLAIPQAANNNGIVVKGIAGWDGTQAYGKGQGFLLLRDDNSGGENLYGTVNAAPDRDVLARIDGRTGGFGTSGGAHFALGLRQHAGFTNSTGNVWINNYLDAHGLVVKPNTDPTGTNTYLIVQKSDNTVYLKVASNGNVTVQAPTVKVYNSVLISHTTSGTAQIVTFDSERWDTDGIHDTSSNTSRLTCKTAGVYAITGQIRFAASAVGIRSLGVRLNGGSNYLGQASVNASATGPTDIVVYAQYKLAVNDYVELEANQSSGGALNMSLASLMAPVFSMTYLCDG